MSNLSTDPIDSPEESPPSKQDEVSPLVQQNIESTNRTISSEYDDTLLNESPTLDVKDNTENSSLGDDFEKIEEGDYMVNEDHKDNIGEDFDIIGIEDDQHFEVLDSAVGDHTSSTTANTNIVTTTTAEDHINKDNSNIEEQHGKNGEREKNVHEATGSEDQDEIDITTTDEIRDKDQDDSGSGGTSSNRDKKSKSISPIRFEKHSETVASKKKSDGSSSSKGDSGPHRITDKLFHNTRYFVMKSNNYENVEIAKTKNVWSTLPYNEKKLNKAYRDCKNVLLIYSVKESGCFQGFAKLVSESRTDTQRVPWVLPPTISASQLNSVFKLDWIHRGNLDFNLTMDLKNPWNENKPVKISRDGQEIEPAIGEKLCKLWCEISSEDDSGAPRDKRKGLINQSRKDGGGGGIPPYPHHMTPMLHYPPPPLPIYHDGRHGPPQIHLNPTLYPPLSKHHLTEAEELLSSSKRRKMDRGSSSHSKSDRVIRHHSRSPIRDYKDSSSSSSSSRRYKGGESSSSRRRRSRSRSRSRERSSTKYKDHKERSSRDKSKKSSGSHSNSSSGGTFEKNFGVSKETLLHGSYADYIKEYTARSSRTGQQPMDISQIASQYQKALSQVASALASQTATQQQQPLDPQTYNKKVEEFLERTKQKSS